jgi:integrase
VSTLNLALLALSLFQRFIVGDLRDKVGDIGSERLLDKLARDLAVFDGVVKQRCNNQIRVFALACFCHHRAYLGSLVRKTSKPIGNALWVSSHGTPMSAMEVYNRIRKHTQEAFGAPINTHLFRDAAATTLAIADPENVRVAAPLLGHRTFTTTERYYQQAKSFEAHRQYITALFGKNKVS